MSFSLLFRPEVLEDAVAGARWYEEKAAGLGEEFLRAFYAGAEEAVKNPLACRRVFDDIRRKMLRRFPYAIYYCIDKRRVVVFGLFHSARSPLYVDDALNNRPPK